MFGSLASLNFLEGLDTAQFIEAITDLAAELNALHPFRDGNGRTVRLFLIKLADRAGYLLDYSQVSAEELIAADRLVFEGDLEPLLTLYSKVVIN